MPIEILMPALSPTMTEGNLAKWLKKEGDKVSPGDVIAEIETDKATMEVESIDEGTIGKILIKEGAQGVAVNSVIALMLEEGEDKSAIKDYKPKSTPANDSKDSEEKAENGTSSNTQNEQPTVQATNTNAATNVPSFTAPPTAPVITKDKIKTSSVQTDNSKINASPVAKRIAKEASIDLSIVTGTGPKGRIIRADVEAVIKSGGAGKRVARNPIEMSQLPNDNMRKTIANRLLQSKQHVPHFYLTIECNIDKLLETRADLNKAAPIFDDKPAYKISVNDLIIKASALALKKVPQANASWTEDAILLYNNVDVSVAVAIDGGLITPIVRNADQKDLPGISNEMKKLAAKARDGKLAPEEFQGGGFSISNLGMYGIKHFSAIINPPQSCILAVGSGQKKPIVDENGNIKVANIMEVTLSSDHRVVDGTVGAEFLTAFKGYIEKPVTMFV